MPNSIWRRLYKCVQTSALALLFNNQGYVKEEFRAGLALVRIAESSLTATAYYFLGLYSSTTPQLMLMIVPSVILGVPLGIALLRRIEAETFRRVCMSFDAWVVGFGLSRTLIELGVLASPQAYSVLAVTIVVDGWLLFRYFAKAGKKHPSAFTQPSPPPAVYSPHPQGTTDSFPRTDVSLSS